MMFRLTFNDKANNADGGKLGDRVLAIWANRGQFLHGTTHRYDNMVGAGDANINSNF